ncbi:MAG: chemotaxis protein CheW [Candidatus Heimdallarchaeota archaeon]|nr:chemotaxis protein CheW [Candidatus Heimdallarchaeota archaeon]
MDISDKCALYPFASINSRKEVLLSYVDYVRGICDLDRAVCMIIDFADFLGTTPVLNEEDLMILRVTVKKGDFALIIPSPKMIRDDLQFEESNGKIKSSDSKITLISSNYVIINNEVYLKIDVEQLSTYIAFELSKYLTKEWKNSTQNLSFDNKDNLAKIVEQSFITKKMENSIVENNYTRNNIIICNVGNYQFSFSEKYLSEIKYFNQILTSIPDTPDWVKGAIDHQNDSLPLVDLADWLGINSNESNNKLLVIIERDKSTKFGFLCDSVTNIEKPENHPIQHFESLNIEGLPFRNIVYSEKKFIFSLNIDTLASSISSGATLNFMQEWDSWKPFLHRNNKEVIDGLKAISGEYDNLELQEEFVEINFKQINILIDLSENLTFFTNQSGRKFNKFPHYCDGLVELGGTHTLIIDLARYLGINEDQIDEYLLIKLIDKNVSIALKVPIPRVGRYNIDSKSTIILDNNTQSLRIPSTQYYIIEDKVYLKFDRETLFEFLENELQDYLRLGWKNSLPNWDLLNPDKLVKIDQIKTKITNYSPKVVVSNLSSSNNYLICNIEGSFFAISEDDIIQVISTEIKVTKVPGSPLWMKGVMDYQNKDVVILDLSKLLQLQTKDKSKPVIVVASTTTGPIAFQCNSVYHLSNQSMVSIKKNELISSNLPYTNVYNVEGRIIYQLNVDYLQKSIAERKDTLIQNEWLNLLSVSEEDYRKNLSTVEKNQIYRNNSIRAKIGNDNFTVPLDDIVTIRSVVDQERITSDGLNLSAYSNTWIPSIRICDQFGSEGQHKISLILKCEDFVFELQVDELQLTELGQKLIDASTWDALIGGNSPIGLKTPFQTKDGLAFGLDLNDLLLKSYTSILKGEDTLTNFIDGLSLDPPEFIEESTLLSKQITNIWDEDAELYLIIIDTSENTKSALNTELISKISLETDPNIELFPWENNKSESHFYITTTLIGQHQKALQIPANCFLVGVSRESINNDDRFTYVTLEDEKIPILEIKNGV